MTIAPARTAAGAYSRAVPLPAENSARSTPAKLSALSVSTPMSWSRNGKVLPAERGEASSRSSPTGNSRSARMLSSSAPTAPVAPTMATAGGDRRRR